MPQGIECGKKRTIVDVDGLMKMKIKIKRWRIITARLESAGMTRKHVKKKRA